MFKQEEDVTIDDWTLLSKCGIFIPSSTYHRRPVSVYMYMYDVCMCVCQLCVRACVYVSVCDRH